MNMMNMTMHMMDMINTMDMKNFTLQHLHGHASESPLSFLGLIDGSNNHLQLAHVSLKDLLTVATLGFLWEHSLTESNPLSRRG